MKKQRTGIIGAGIAGIAAAIRLAIQGHEVTVFEANSYPGGKLSAFDLGGYRFDAGPSLFTMPQYVDALFEEAGEQAPDFFKYERIDVVCHYFWPDGTSLKAWADSERFAAEVETHLGVSAEKVRRFLARSAGKYESAGRIFLEKSLHLPSTWLHWKVARAMLRLPFFDIFESMHQTHQKAFEGNAKAVQLFDRFATYNGSDPYQASGMLTIIPHFEHNIGVFYPEGGMHAITRSLYDLSVRKGVKYQFSTPVEKIGVEGKKITGVYTAGDVFHPFEKVVSNMDVFYTYKKLLPDQQHPEHILQQPKSTSALIFYWGIKKTFTQLGMHNIFFSENYQREFEMLGKGQMTDDPTLYLNITSKLTPTDAPVDGENWFILVNAPCHQGQDWGSMIPAVRQQVIDKFSKMLGEDIAPLIECEEILEPRTIDQKTSSHLGALYGYSSNNTMAAFLRHPNFTRRINGLYFVGGSVHPGGGIPLCLLSAKIASDLIAKE